MKPIFQIISWLALAGILVCTAFFFADRLDLDLLKVWLLVWTAVWFVSTPFWMECRETG